MPDLPDREQAPMPTDLPPSLDPPTRSPEHAERRFQNPPPARQPDPADAHLHLGDSVLALLEPLQVRTARLELYARAAPGNHPCTRFGGFDSAEQMATSKAISPRLKGAVGWSDLEEMYRAEIEQARAHGAGGLAQLEGIEDEVWRLSSEEPARVAVLAGHRVTTLIDLTGRAVEEATPLAPQTLVIEALRVYSWGALAGVELPPPAPVMLPGGGSVTRRERHVVVFPDRVELQADKLGRFFDLMPRVSRRGR